ncbi:MAG: hypothetical protein RL368_1032 [Pseudomonadota bacterium]|jgi:hypothetical protein
MIKNSLKKFTQLLGVLLASVIASPSNQAFAAEFIINGGFEGISGDVFAKWSVSGTAIRTVPAAIVGSSSASFNFGDALVDAAISQTVTTVVGKQYILRFKYCL